MFVSVVDLTGVTLALPLIADHFDATIPAVQWVALGYGLTTGSLLLPMGRLSDIIGRKRVYVTGFVIFALGALLAGSSSALLGVILFKAMQGVGAAMIQANGMAIIASAFPSNERGKAIGLFVTTTGTGAVVGPVVGGLVAGLLGWRYVLFAGAPLGILSIIAALIVLEGTSARTAGAMVRRLDFDWPGAALSAMTLAVFMLVMTNAYRVGWSSPLVVGGFATVVMLAVAFIWWELRAPEPMLALDLFKHSQFYLGSSAGFFAFMAGHTVFFFIPFFLQGVQGRTPGQAGLIIAPAALAYAMVGPVVGRLSDKFGWRRFTVLGLTVSAAAIAALSRSTEATSLWLVVAGMVAMGLGMGIFSSPNASSILGAVPRSRYGIATAFLQTVRNASNVTGVVVATAIITAIMASRGFEPSLDAVSAGVGSEGLKAAFTEGLRIAFMVLSGCVVFGVLVSVLSREPKVEQAALEPDQQLPSKV